jgi:sugar/nucleoside kinase (ribokinase family)
VPPRSAHWPQANGARSRFGAATLSIPVGAGDAFNAGYIAVRLRGGSIDEALKAGVHCGAAVTAASSDTAGFPRELRL